MDHLETFRMCIISSSAVPPSKETYTAILTPLLPVPLYLVFYTITNTTILSLSKRITLDLEI